MFTERERSFLAAMPVGRLATVTADGVPHVVPVCYALVDDRVVTPIDEKPKSVPASDLQRVRDVRENDRVALVVDRYTDDWSSLAWVQIRGRASVRGPDEGDHDRAVGALERRYEQYADQNLAARPRLVIEPRRVLSWGLD